MAFMEGTGLARLLMFEDLLRMVKASEREEEAAL